MTRPFALKYNLHSAMIKEVLKYIMIASLSHGGWVNKHKLSIDSTKFNTLLNSCCRYLENNFYFQVIVQIY